MLITNISPIDELKGTFIEMLLNNTDLVTKVSDGSVLNGISYGVSKIAQKTAKDIALIEGQLFPDYAYGAYLDTIALRNGISSRHGAIGSSTYLRIVGDPGTAYLSTTHTFTGSHGVVFELEDNFTIPAIGYGYAKVRSVITGAVSNVDSLTITKLSPQLNGHKYVINEYGAMGGLDIETDDVFRKRIKEGANLLSRGTLSMLEQVFMKFNPNVLRVFHNGFNSKGQIVIAIVTQNGINLSVPEINDLLLKSESYLNLTESKPSGTNTYGVDIVNVNWYPIDVSVRLDLESNFNTDFVRKQMQLSYSKYLDYRTWKDLQIVEWDDLLSITKRTDGVKYVYDNYFFLTVYDGITPIQTHHKDLPIPRNTLPRIQGFQLLDRNGNIISNTSNTLNPFYYPNRPDGAYTSTVLNQI